MEKVNITGGYITKMASEISKKEKISLPHHHGEEKNIDMLQKELSDVEHFAAVAEVFKQLGDGNRVRLFWLLCHHEECVINIAAMMDMSSPAISHHLRMLTDCGLVISRRDGKEVYYRAADTEAAALLHKTVERVMEVACPGEKLDYSSSPEELIEAIHDYLMEHISERITIEELSKRFLMNSTTLKKAFKARYSTSIALHMKEHRMELAKKLLIETDDSIQIIAGKTGYESQSRFTQAFKESFGMLPTEYRKNKRSR